MTKLHEVDILAAHRRYYDEREKMALVARAYAVDRTTLHYAFVRLELPRRPYRGPRAPLAPAQLADARQRLDVGESLDDIAEMLSMSGRTLRRRLTEAGYSVRKGAS